MDPDMESIFLFYNTWHYVYILCRGFDAVGFFVKTIVIIIVKV